MDFRAKVTPIEKTSRDGDEMFLLRINTYKDKLEGKFEKSELRHLIEIIDNAI